MGEPDKLSNREKQEIAQFLFGRSMRSPKLCADLDGDCFTMDQQQIDSCACYDRAQGFCPLESRRRRV